MLYFFIALIIIASILLVFIVLIQNPKGGGLVSGFAGTNTIMGVKRTGDILEKGTWVLVIGIMVLSLLINVVGISTQATGSNLQNEITPTTAPAAALTTSPEAIPALPQRDTTN